MNIPVNEIVCGSALDVLRTFPAESVNCCISSPPYWGLRDYGVDGQLGLETSYITYLHKLCDIYDEVKRVLRKDGCVFVNLGDTYNSQPAGNLAYKGNLRNKAASGVVNFNSPKKVDKSLPEKSLCLIPQRFAIEMVNRGWILRNTIIWHKPNPMPSSAKDRFTVDFEYVYFFVKSKKYWFEPQYEPKLDPQDDIRRITKAAQYKTQSDKGVAKVDNWKLNLARATLGRNKRTVWTIPTQAFPEAHFATFPEKLVEPMVLSGCPEFVCKKCGKGRVKVIQRELPPEKVYTKTRGCDDSKVRPNIYKNKGSGQKVQNWLNEHPPTFKGYTDCGCNAGWRHGIILDMFGGAMTTALVAYRNRRDYVMIELSETYIKMGKKRLEKEKEKFGLFEKSLDNGDNG